MSIAEHTFLKIRLKDKKKAEPYLHVTLEDITRVAQKLYPLNSFM